jgi:DNA-binding beta-propeller fold protein YncE
MSSAGRVTATILLVFAIFLGRQAASWAQSGLPNPYRPVKGLADGGGPSVPGGDWARLPGGREMGPPASVHVDIDGESIWAVIRCDETSPLAVASGGRFGIDCLGPDNRIKKIDTVYKFNAQGNVVKSFGAGMFIWPHGLVVDREGNVWVTDAVGAQGVAMAAKAGVKAGHQIFKFSPDGKLLMTLGEAGVPGSDNGHFTSPSAVAIGANGDIFVADGHDANGNNRVMKFTKEGKFIKSWGKTGYGPGEFRSLHAIAIDARGRVFVADRSNNRIQLFDQEGKHLQTWTQFGTPSGIFFDDKDQIYVADSESDNQNNPGWEQGIRIGDAKTGWVHSFILDQGGNPNTPTGSGPEFVTVDRHGNVFGGEPRPRVLRKYVKVR